MGIKVPCHDHQFIFGYPTCVNKLSPRVQILCSKLGSLACMAIDVVALHACVKVRALIVQKSLLGKKGETAKAFHVQVSLRITTTGVKNSKKVPSCRFCLRDYLSVPHPPLNTN